MIAELRTKTSSQIEKTITKYKLIYYNSTSLEMEDDNHYITEDTTYKGTLKFINNCIYNNTKMIARVQSNDIEIISPDFKLINEDAGIYEKILVGSDGKFLNLEPQDSWQTDFEYKIKNKTLKEGDIASYTVDYYIYGDANSLYAQTHNLKVSNFYSIEYTSKMFEENLPSDETLYYIDDSINLKNMDIDSKDYEFIGWSLDENGKDILDATTTINALTDGTSTKIRLHAVFKDFNENIEEEKEQATPEKPIDSEEDIKSNNDNNSVKTGIGSVDFSLEIFIMTLSFSVLFYLVKTRREVK